MATRVVEREYEWCRSQSVQILTENGHQVDSDGVPDGIMQATCVVADKKRMTYPPRMRTELTSISPRLTRVAISFPIRRGFVVHGIAWIMTVLALFLAVAFMGLALDWQAVTTHRILLFSAAAVWITASLGIGSGVIHSDVTQGDRQQIEQSVWEVLDPDGSVSHQIVEPYPSWLTLCRAVRWSSLCLLVIGALLLLGSCFLPTTESLIKSDRTVGMSPLALSILTLILPSNGTPLGLLFLLCIVPLVMSEWLLCSWRLPHRYHWKVRLWVVYICWYCVLWCPGFFWISYGTSAGFIQFLLVIMVLFGQAASFVCLLAIVPEYRRRGGRGDPFEAPSARYESLSEEVSDKELRRLLNHHRFWTWTSFILFTALCYLAAAYLTVTLVEGVAGILGASWALGRSGHWPLLVPTQGRGAAVQAVVFTCLMGLPLATSVAWLARWRLRLGSRWALGREIAGEAEDLGLPNGPLYCLRGQLAANVLRVAVLPTLDINMEVERTSLAKREYLLWITSGALKNLSSEEIEVLLWHECGHASLVKRTVWREVAAFVAPWAPRFLDLAEDLYEWEREADCYAARKMKTAQPLVSALQKLKEQEIQYKQNRQRSQEADGNRWFSWDSLRIIWDFGWAGYLHPDVEQRLRWLERDAGSRSEPSASADAVLDAGDHHNVPA